MLMGHEIRLILRHAYSWLSPLLFFVIVVCLFPLAVGANPLQLTQLGPSIIWVAALLASVISIGNLFQSDVEDGYLDLILLSPLPLSWLVLCKVFSHWLTHSLPLILVSPLLGFLLHLPFREQLALVITLLLGTPILGLIGSIGAALMIGTRAHGLLLPILIMPFYAPVLIFGTGTITAAASDQPVIGYYAILGALMLVSVVFAPLLAGTALRIGVNQ